MNELSSSKDEATLQMPLKSVCETLATRVVAAPEDTRLLAARWLAMAALCAIEGDAPTELGVDQARSLLTHALEESAHAHDEALVHMAAQQGQLTKLAEEGVADPSQENAAARTGKNMWGKLRQNRAAAVSRALDTSAKRRAARKRRIFYEAKTKGVGFGLGGIVDRHIVAEDRKREHGKFKMVTYWSQCAQYFSDNVLVMICAASGGISYGSIGSGIQWNPTADVQLCIQAVGFVVNVLLCLTLRALLCCLWRNSPMDSPRRALAYHAVTYLLPWMPRVIGSNLMSAINGAILNMSGFATLSVNPLALSDPTDQARGQSAGILALIFVVCFAICVRLSLSTLRDGFMYGPDARTSDYLVQLSFGCLSTITGKTLYFLIDLLTQSLMNVSNRLTGQAWAVLIVVQTFQTLIAIGLVGPIFARLRRGSKSTFQLAQVQTVAYVVAYWWSFSFICNAGRCNSC